MGEENESKHGGCEEHVGQWALLMSLVIQSVGKCEERLSTYNRVMVVQGSQWCGRSIHS